MRIPIPKDWDGESWRCVQIDWPDSPEWIGLLFGFLSYATRGRTWDEKTGLIAEAQDVGWQIWNRNFILRACDGEPPEPPEPPECPEITEELCRKLFGLTGGCGLCFGGNEMPCIDLTNLVKIENGILYVRDICCEWHVVGAFSGFQEDIPDSLETPEEPIPEDLACRKAWYFSHTLAEVGQFGWNMSSQITWDWIGDMRAQYPQLEMSKWKLAEACAYLNALRLLGYVGWIEAWPNDVQQAVLCRWRDVLDPNTLTVTAGEFEQLKTILKSTTGGFAEAYLAAMLDAIGRSGLGWMAVQAQFETAPDCGCPDEGYIIGPDAEGWYLGTAKEVGLVRTGTYNRLCFIHTAEQDIFGAAWKMSWSMPASVLKRMKYASGACTLPKDTNFFDDTSDHMESNPQNWWVVAAAASLYTLTRALLGTGVGHDTGFQHQSENPLVPDPDVVKGKIIGFQIDHDPSDGEGSASYPLGVRFLHNINSPSHGA